MDSSAISWLSEMELELDEPVFGDQCDDFLAGSSLDDEMAAIIGGEPADFDTTTCGFSFENNNNLHSISPPATYPISSNNNDFPAPDPNNAPIILKFGNTDSPVKDLSPEDLKQAKKTRRARPASQTYDHIVAERKRREQLSQRFIILSTIVPGLKRMDKTSVLGDAIKYMKHLQERVKTLEERAKMQTGIEPVVLVRKSQIAADDDIDDSGSSFSSSSELPLPEIRARVSDDRLITIRIQCEKKRGVLVNWLSKVEKLHLVVLNSNVVTFAGFVLDITITAQMEEEFKLTAKEAVKQLRASLKS